MPLLSLLTVVAGKRKREAGRESRRRASRKVARARKVSRKPRRR